MKDLDRIAINNIRVLAMETITKAKSGHPGIALGAAPIMYTLYSKVLRETPKNSKWINRDRFVLAAGHGSSLLYVMLHLNKYNVSIDDLKNFRQIGSNTPGHPEIQYTDGIDASSGPLGQGIPEAIGMAISSKYLASYFNKENYTLFDNYTYVLCGDGDLQEGVTNEALSLAGHLGLSNLIILFDSNDIQLDGEVNKCNTEDIKKKMEAMHFNYLKCNNGEDPDEILKVINKAKKSNKSSFIEIKTIIGKGSIKEGTNSVHGNPLSSEEVIDMRSKFGGCEFGVDSNTYKAFIKNLNKNNKLLKQYNEMLKSYKEDYPLLYNDLMKALNHEDLITKEELNIPFDPNSDIATRNAFGEILKKANTLRFNTIGGSADLVSSTKVAGINGDFSNDTPSGRNIRFGVREHAMGAICNGINLFGITRSFCSGFFVFSDYLKPAIRLSSLMDLGVIYIFSHDSIAVGEDGPTHEPIEQISMLRSQPNLNVIRPASFEETKEAFVIAYNSYNTPTVILTTRQNVKEVRTNENYKDNLTSFGAYIISKEDETKNLDGVIIATGSEVGLAVNVKNELINSNLNFRVVSMPSMYLFDKQSDEYKKSIIPDNKYIIGIEMSDAIHMYKYINGGRLFNINTFGLSGKANDVINHFGFNVSNISNIIKKDLNK